MGLTAEISQPLQFALRMTALVGSVRALFQSRDPHSRASWERHILVLLREAISADAGAVLLEDYEPQPCIVPDSWTLEMQTGRGPMRGIVHADRLEGEGAKAFAIAAPMLVRGELAGLFYLERASPAFDDDDSLLLTAAADVAAATLEGVYRQEWLVEDVDRLQIELHPSQLLAGESVTIRTLRERIDRIAPTPSTVLVMGESGTGKELVARALHNGSARAHKPFVAINCAALTETLLESELFGHEKGAFTGAFAQKRGRLECAEGGTVFLDEIGDMPLGLQAKLLRVLQAREFERVGGTRTLPLDIRVLAATNRNLEESSRQGTFRQDLFYRLNVITIRTPSLRERPEDIVPLALRFASVFANDSGREVHGISPDARSALRSYPWPGNVRELQNAMEHAVVMGTSDTVRAEDLPDTLHETFKHESEPGGLQDAIDRAKRVALSQAFEKCHHDHNEAARLLGIHPNYLYRLIRKLGMNELLKGIARE